MAQAPDPVAVEVVRDLKERLKRRFGDRLVAVYLFGSRARGDHRPDSDTDVAVFLDDDRAGTFDQRYDVIEDSYDLLLERGLYIQPWTFPAGAIGNPDRFPAAHLTRAVLRDGVRV
ncbi:nucleotidyltransferase domain-containing protein [Azospirillum sp. sgz302134]